MWLQFEVLINGLVCTQCTLYSWGVKKLWFSSMVIQKLKHWLWNLHTVHCLMISRTQAYFTHKVRKVGEEVDLGAKKLCPFDLMANRNQARAITHNDVGMSCFDRRNASYIRWSEVWLAICSNASCMYVFGGTRMISSHANSEQLLIFRMCSKIG